MKKIWIDTDAGTDDAVALIMAMRSPDIEILGISCVAGNVPLDKVVQNVLYICELCHQKIPVFVGSSHPLKRVLATADFIHGSDGLGDVGRDLTGREPQATDAWLAMMAAVQRYPNEVTLVNLGPLTNLARVIERQPDIVHSVQHCYIMGGLITLPGNVTPMSEFNIWADPEAASIVIASEMPMTTIGWDTTMDSGWLSVQEWEDIRLLDSDLATFAYEIQGVRMQWQRDHGEDLRLTWADPCAMAVVLHPDIVRAYKKVAMHVNCAADEDPFRGHIHISEYPRISHVTAIDRARFVTMILEALM